MALLLVPVMTIMWLCTTGCVKLMVPKLTTLTAMVIASLVTSTDPVLSQAIAKGPFADKYVPRALREIISAEAGANDGFGFPFLLLATYLIRHTPEDDINFKPDAPRINARSGDVGRLGGDAGKAIETWVVEGWLYFILLGAVIGAVMGIASMSAITFTLRRFVRPISPSSSHIYANTRIRKWIDTESLLLYPTALGLLAIGVCGLTGTDDLLACFCAGAAMNWNGTFLRETLARHDEVNSSIDVLLNFGGFMYIGAIMPWSEFNSDVTGITPGRLIALGLLVLLLRRIPAMLVIYKAMPNTVKTWREALFMGYFGPIGIGAVFYVEHAFHLYPKLDAVETHEEEDLLHAMRPVVYFLVLFSILVHGLSIPALELIYRWRGVKPIVESEPSLVRRRSISEPLPPNSHMDPRCGSVVRHNRFSRVISREDGNDDVEDAWSTRSRAVSFSRPASRGVSWVSRPGSRATSRANRIPDAPVLQLSDTSEDTIRKEREEKESPRIQFVDDERVGRSPRPRNNDFESRNSSSFAMT